MINANAAFDKNGTAALGEHPEEAEAIELFHHWRDRNAVYDLTIFRRIDDLTFSMSREELKALGHALVRLADATFLEPSP
jgi:hypothetical protein